MFFAESRLHVKVFFKDHLSVTFLFSLVPVYTDKDQQLAVTSIGFLLNNGLEMMPLLWRGPKKNGIHSFMLCNYFFTYLDLFKLVN